MSMRITCLSSIPVVTFQTPTPSQEDPPSTFVLQDRDNTTCKKDYSIEHDHRTPSSSMLLRKPLIQHEILQAETHLQTIDVASIVNTKQLKSLPYTPCRDEVVGNGPSETRPDTQDILVHVSNVSAASNKGIPVWDIVCDNENLRTFYRHRRNLVLDSVHPEILPHIVITPADDSWDDQYVAWNNRIDFQWAVNLTVPRLNLLTGRLLVLEDYGNRVEPLSYSHPPVDSSSPQVALSEPRSVFNRPRFKEYVRTLPERSKLVDSTSTERLVLVQVVRALQKQKCKNVFFEACAIAVSFRKRYDILPEIFGDLEPSFTWSDPGEAILIATCQYFGITILDSPNPFLTPHIVISTPPPQSYVITEHNATPTPQDCGYGQYLTVPSCLVETINTSDDWVLSHPGLIADHSPSSSQSGTPPETPIDDEDDFDFFFARYGDDDQDGIANQPQYPSILDLDANADDHMCALQISRTTQPIFTTEDSDDDSLPPFDDWYK